MREEPREHDHLRRVAVDPAQLAFRPEAREDPVPLGEQEPNPLELARSRADDDVRAHGLEDMRLRRHSSGSAAGCSTVTEDDPKSKLSSSLLLCVLEREAPEVPVDPDVVAAWPGWPARTTTT